MYTRATKLSTDHIQAVNRIELAFYKDETVMTAFRAYLDMLFTPTGGDDEQYVIQKRGELFVDLLYSMAQLLHYPFTKLDLRKNAYIPQGHVDLDIQQQQARKAALEILEGKMPLRVSVDQK